VSNAQRYMIAVQPTSLGQVLACLGFLELANCLGVGREGGFEPLAGMDCRFAILGPADANPFEAVLEFLGDAELEEQGVDGSSRTYPAPKEDGKNKPIALSRGDVTFVISQQTERNSGLREALKLYVGGRSATDIVEKLRDGDGNKLGIKQLISESRYRDRLLTEPFEVTVPCPAGFNFDPRVAWNSLDDGYSMNQQKQPVLASPIVEILAAVGLQHARPLKDRDSTYCAYWTWEELLPLPLARAALGGADVGVRSQRFSFKFGSKGDSKTVTEATVG
jgi:CRISPR-associated protein Csb3